MRHQAFFVELPQFIAIAAKPLAGMVVPFVFESDGHAVFAKSPQLFFENVVELAFPFAFQELLDRFADSRQSTGLPQHLQVFHAKTAEKQARPHSSVLL